MLSALILSAALSAPAQCPGGVCPAPVARPIVTVRRPAYASAPAPSRPCGRRGLFGLFRPRRCR